MRSSPLQQASSSAPGPTSAAPAPRELPGGLVWVLFVALGLALYAPCLRGGLLWDDPAHLIAPALRTWEGLRGLWAHLYGQQQYYPVVSTAFWLEARLWGDATLGYHVANVVWHASTAAVLVLVLRRLRLPGGLWAGLLFLIHPVCVESVAWMSEQKNTLSGLFAAASVLAFVWFQDTRGWRPYAAAFLLFVLAVLTKSVTATTAGVLLCLAWWRHGQLELRRDLLPLLPWFAVGAGFGLLTAWIERTHVGARGTEFDLGSAQRVLLASRILVFYLGKLLWPADLLFTYPRWTITFQDGRALAAALSVLLLTAVCVARAWSGAKAGTDGRASRGPLALLLIYAGLLFPALGFLNVYPFVFSYVADHFQYFAAAAALGNAAAAWAGWTSKHRAGRGWLSLGLPLALVAVLGLRTHRQAALYADAETLYRVTLEGNPAAWMAHNNLGVILAKDPGRHDEAVAHFREAVRLHPGGPDLHFNLANSLAKQPATVAEAEREYRRALELSPGFADAHNNLGRLLAGLPGRADEAVDEFRAATRLRPDFAEAHANLALSLAPRSSNAPEALAEYNAALGLEPQLLPALLGRAALLARLPGRESQAREDYAAALRLEPDNADAHFQLGRLLGASGDRAGALREYEAALRLEPDREAVRALVEALRSGGGQG